MSLLENLPHLCKIQKRKMTRDSLGGNRETRVVEQTNVPCWEQPLSASEIELYSKRGMIVSKTIFFASDPKVTELHEIIITKDYTGIVPESRQVILEVISDSRPDATAGLGVAFNIVVNQRTGQSN